MARKRKNFYFTKDTEEAILEYVASTHQPTRNKIYRERIDHAFFKLTQNIINTFKFHYTDGVSIEDLQQEVICFLLEKLDKYKQENGAAFSYFGTIAKRYLILKNNKNYKKLKNKEDISVIDEDKNITNDIVNNEFKNQPFFEEDYTIKHFIEYVELHESTIFDSEEDKKTSWAIIELFKRRENIEIFNKKALLLYIREMTGQETPQITKISKKLKKIYNRLRNQYDEYGFISLNF